jgi:hypothetical protein
LGASVTTRPILIAAAGQFEKQIQRLVTRIFARQAPDE